MRSRTIRLTAIAALAGAALALPPGAARAVETPMTISATSLDFGNVVVGTTASMSVTLTNTGGQPFGPINMFGGAPPTPEFGASQNCQGKTLPAGGTCSVSYSFTPSAAGTFNDSSNFTISETTSQADGEQFSVSLTGTGRSTIPPVVSPDVTGPGVLDPTDGGGTTSTTTTTDVTTSTTTATTTTATTTTTTTTVPAATTTAAAPTSSSAPTTAPPITAPPANIVVVVPGPLAFGGSASVIAQGIVAFPAGAFHWDHQVLDLTSGPFSFQTSPPVLFASDGSRPLLLRGGPSGTDSLALLDRGEGAFVPAGSSGDLASLIPPALGGTAIAHRITFVSGSTPESFVPGEERRDVNLVRGILEPGQSLRVTSLFPVFAVVTDGELVDTDSGLTLTPGVGNALATAAELHNSGATTAVVLVATIGGPVP